MVTIRISTGSLYAPFITVDPTLGILTGILVVSGVLIYAYYPAITQSLSTVDRTAHFSVKDELNKLIQAKINNITTIESWIDHMSQYQTQLRKLQGYYVTETAQYVDGKYVGSNPYGSMGWWKTESIINYQKSISECQEKLRFYHNMDLDITNKILSIVDRPSSPTWHIYIAQLFDAFRNLTRLVPYIQERVCFFWHNEFFSLTSFITSLFFRISSYVMLNPWEVSIMLTVFSLMPVIFKMFYMAVYCNNIVLPSALYTTFYQYDRGRLNVSSLSNTTINLDVVTTWYPANRLIEWLPWQQNSYCLESSINFALGIAVGGTVIGIISTVYFIIYTHNYFIRNPFPLINLDWWPSAIFLLFFLLRQ